MGNILPHIFIVDIVHHVFSGLCNMLSVGNFCYNNHLKLKINFLPIKYIFLFRIKDTVSDILSVLLNFIANYDSKNENIPPYCL